MPLSVIVKEGGYRFAFITLFISYYACVGFTQYNVIVSFTHDSVLTRSYSIYNSYIDGVKLQ